MPAHVAHVVGWFWSLDARRTGQWVAGAGYAPNPLSWPEIEAWARVSGVRLEPWESAALSQMDDVRLRHFANRRDGASPENLPALTGDALDMMLGGGA